MVLRLGFDPAVLKRYLGSGLRRGPFYFFLLPLYFLSFLVPRNPRLWIFGALDGRGYTGNTRALASYVRARVPEVRAVWLASSREVCARMRELGLECYGKYSPMGFWLSARAKVLFVTHHLFDVNPFTSGGAEVVQTWHGVPLKKIDFDTIESGVYRRFLLAWEPFGVLYRRAHTFRRAWVLATSEETARTLGSGFLVPKERIWITGYPRNDYLFDSGLPLLEEEARLAREIEELRARFPGAWVGLYAPTFRWRGGGVVERVLGSADRWRTLDETLEEANLFLYIKLHPWEAEKTAPVRAEFGTRLRRVRFFSTEDPYPLLSRFDFLSTDYSSIYFDYLLLDRPLVFFPFDLEDFTRHSRALHYPYDEVTPGPKARDFAGWLDALARVREEAGRWREERARVRERFFAHRDGRSSERVVERVLRLLGASGFR